MSAVEDIKKLRERTGAGMMDAKAALVEAKGDINKAIEVLRKKGQARAAKRADRVTAAGLIDGYLHMGRVGALVEVNCETDFVARTDDFKQLVHEIAMQVAAANPLYLAPGDVPPEVVTKEKQLYSEELQATPAKPQDVVDKVIDGKLAKFYQEVCLLKQPWVKDDSKTIEDLLTELIAKLGENIVIARFSRLELGVQNA